MIEDKNRIWVYREKERRGARVETLFRRDPSLSYEFYSGFALYAFLHPPSVSMGHLIQ